MDLGGGPGIFFFPIKGDGFLPGGFFGGNFNGFGALGSDGLGGADDLPEELFTASDGGGKLNTTPLVVVACVGNTPTELFDLPFGSTAVTFVPGFGGGGGGGDCLFPTVVGVRLR